MAMLLVVATTEATDPTRVSVSFRTTANVSESSSLRLRDEARGINGTCRVVSPEKEVMHHGR
jgi:hypothetical protein